MDKNEYNAKLEEISRYVDQGNYAEAARVADQIDWKRVRNVRTLCLVSEIYEAEERYEDSKEMLLKAYKKSPSGRAILYRLVEVCITLKQFDEAVEYYSRYVHAAPNDPNRLILKYKIYRGRGSSVDEQIEILQEYLKEEYNEKYAYELAKLYQEADRISECLTACDDLVLWFHSGKYVIRALELKKRYAPLTPKQQEIYDHRFDEPNEEEVIGAEKQMVETENTTLAESIMEDTTREIASEVAAATDDDKTGQLPEASESGVGSETEAVPDEDTPGEGNDFAGTRVIEHAGTDVMDGVFRAPAGMDTQKPSAESVPAAQVAAAAAAIALEEAALEEAALDGVSAKVEALVTEEMPATEEVSATGEEPASVEEPVSQEASPVERPFVIQEDRFNTKDFQEEMRRSMQEVVAGVGLRDTVDEDEAAMDALIDKSKQEQADRIDSDAARIRMTRKLTLPELQKKADAGQLSIDDVLLSMGDKGVAVRETIADAESAAGVRPQRTGVLSAVDEALLNMGVRTGEETREEVPDELKEEVPGEVTEETEEAQETVSEEIEQAVPDEIEQAVPDEIKEEAGEETQEAVQEFVQEERQEAAPETEQTTQPDKELPEDTVEMLVAGILAEEAAQTAAAVIQPEVSVKETVTVEGPEEPLKEAATVEGPEEPLKETATVEQSEEPLKETVSVEQPEEEAEDEDVTIAQVPHAGAEVDAQIHEAYEQAKEGSVPEASKEAEAEAEKVAAAGVSAHEAMSMKEVMTAATRRVPTEEIAKRHGQTPLTPDEIEAAKDGDNAPDAGAGHDRIAPGAAAEMGEAGEKTPQEADGAPSEEKPAPAGAGSAPKQPERMWLKKELRGFFEGYLGIRDMDRQIAGAIEQILAKGDDKTSRTGNVLIFGGHGCGKTTIGTGIAKAIAQERGSGYVKMAKIYAADLNRKDIAATIARIAGGVLIVEEAGDLDDMVADQLTTALEFRTDGLILILEDEQRYIHDLLMRHPRLTMKFTSQIYIPPFTASDLVGFAALYADDRDYVISDEAAAVLKEKLTGLIENSDNGVSITNVLDITDEAIARANKFSRKLFSGKKRFDGQGRVILQDKDFR